MLDSNQDIFDKSIYRCFICSCDIISSDLKDKINHIKKCGQKNNIQPKDIVYINDSKYIDNTVKTINEVSDLKFDSKILIVSLYIKMPKIFIYNFKPKIKPISMLILMKAISVKKDWNQ